MGHIKVNQTSIEAFIEQANLHHPTIEFTAKKFDTETAFLDPVVYKGTRCKEKCILDAKTRFKQTENLLAHISPRVTLQVLKKDLSKEKP